MSKDAAEGILRALEAYFKQERREWLREYRRCGDPYASGGARAVQNALEHLQALRDTQ